MNNDVFAERVRNKSMKKNPFNPALERVKIGWNLGR